MRTKLKSIDPTVDTLPALGYSIEQFCEAASIKRTLFYTLQKEGRGPRTVKLGKRVIIPVAEAQSWFIRIAQCK